MKISLCLTIKQAFKLYTYKKRKVLSFSFILQLIKLIELNFKF